MKIRSRDHSPSISNRLARGWTTLSAGEDREREREREEAFGAIGRESRASSRSNGLDRCGFLSPQPRASSTAG